MELALWSMVDVLWDWSIGCYWAGSPGGVRYGVP